MKTSAFNDSMTPVERGSRRAAAQPKQTNFRWICLLCLILTALIAGSADAQIQQAWVARYNNGDANGFNYPNKIAVDSAGDICITGWSRNALGSYTTGYITIKYAPNGQPLWESRLDSPSYPNAAAISMVVDASNNVIVTGNVTTIKYDAGGHQLWTAPYAGAVLATDSQANVYVGRFSTNFGTVKLSPQGSNVWLTTYVDPYGPTLSQSVLVDASNNVYVSGLDTYFAYTNNNMRYGPFVQLTTIKYDSNGNQVWKASQSPLPELSNVQIGGAALDAANNLYL
ncbi:MAG TPA: hypothetical protein VGO59_05705, partial [Verrucomicrobiae bacterium]